MPSPTISSLITLVVLGLCIYGIVASWQSYNKAKKSVQMQKDQKVPDVILGDSVKAMNSKRTVAIVVTVVLVLVIIGVLLWYRSAVR